MHIYYSGKLILYLAHLDKNSEKIRQLTGTHGGCLVGVKAMLFTFMQLMRKRTVRRFQCFVHLQPQASDHFRKYTCSLDEPQGTTLCLALGYRGSPQATQRLPLLYLLDAAAFYSICRPRRVSFGVHREQNQAHQGTANKRSLFSGNSMIIIQYTPFSAFQLMNIVRKKNYDKRKAYSKFFFGVKFIANLCGTNRSYVQNIISMEQER